MQLIALDDQIVHTAEIGMPIGRRALIGLAGLRVSQVSASEWTILPPFFIRVCAVKRGFPFALFRSDIVPMSVLQKIPRCYIGSTR